MEYKTAVEYLKNSMMYQMSLGSKELYHSNIWWWLIENDKNFIKAFIPDFEPSKYQNGKNIKATREELNRDILNGDITLNSSENKPGKLTLVLNNHSFSGTLNGTKNITVDGNNKSATFTGGTFSGELKADKSTVNLDGTNLTISGKIDSYLGTIVFKNGDFKDATISVTTPISGTTFSYILIDGGTFKDNQQIAMNHGAKDVYVKINKSLVADNGINASESNMVISMQDGKHLVLVPSTGKQVHYDSTYADENYYVLYTKAQQ